MKARGLLAGLIVCLLGVSARAEDKIDYAKMVVGKWEVSKADEGTVPVGTAIEFTKDGKFIVEGKKDDADIKHEGTYKVEKDTFTFTLTINGEERKQTITITKITNTEIATKSEEGKVVEMKKKK